ncbi:MAG: hypothetical protein HRT87_12555 [Legionellales bacterium]|nr:hypothetical protein [Legionellales bacterium]
MPLNLKYKFLFNYLDKKIPTSKYQILNIGDCFISSRDIDFDVTKKAISSTGTCGVSRILELAKIKAISEFVEREAFKNSGTKSSTGFAAYPFIFNASKAKEKAKVHAFNETVERYVLYQWDKKDDIKFEIYNSPHIQNKELYLAIQKEIAFLEYYKITPTLINNQDTQAVILYAKTKYGWTFGSAANKCPIEAELNAIKELYMHCIGLYRMLEKQIEPQSNHEKQILWISEQDNLIQNKIHNIGKTPIQIPNPLYKNIETKYNDCYSVEQCYFLESIQQHPKSTQCLYL